MQSDVGPGGASQREDVSYNAHSRPNGRVSTARFFWSIVFHRAVLRGGFRTWF